MTSFTIRGKPAEIRKEDNPGPGSYSVIDAYVRSKSPSVKLGTSSRKSIVEKILN